MHVHATLKGLPPAAPRRACRPCVPHAWRFLPLLHHFPRLMLMHVVPLSCLFLDHWHVKVARQSAVTPPTPFSHLLLRQPTDSYEYVVAVTEEVNTRKRQAIVALGVRLLILRSLLVPGVTDTVCVGKGRLSGFS